MLIWGQTIIGQGKNLQTLCLIIKTRTRSLKLTDTTKITCLRYVMCLLYPGMAVIIMVCLHSKIPTTTELAYQNHQY